MRALVLTAVGLVGLLLPASAGAHDLAQDSARSVAAWVGERGVEDPNLPFSRSRVVGCIQAGEPRAGHAHVWRCDVMLAGTPDAEDAFLLEGANYGCLYKVTVALENDESPQAVTRHELFDCTTGRPSRFGLTAGSSYPLPPRPDELPPAPPESRDLDVLGPFGRGVQDVFAQWAREARVPVTPYPMTLRVDELCPSSPNFYCANIEGNVYFEPVETDYEARGPRRYDFLHEIGHLYEYDVFSWAGDVRAFRSAAAVASTKGNPARRVSDREKFAEAYASCAFDTQRLARHRAYRSYGWRPPVARHRRMCALIEASWERFKALGARPREDRQLAFSGSRRVGR